MLAVMGWRELTRSLAAHTMRYIVCAAQQREPVTDVFDTLRMELRRGSLVLAVLAALRSEKYGYTLRKSLAERGLEIDEGTLYPLLRRLEAQGLLESEWRQADGRNKRFYRLAAQGRVTLKQLLAEWNRINDSLDGIV
jgi:PadR family transcriptional regulator, regulatory protein PadR